MNDTQTGNILTHTRYPLTTAGPYPNWGVGEDGVKEYEVSHIPELLTDPDYKVDTEVYAAFDVYAEQLRKAEGLVCDARDLAGLMLAAISDEYDARAMQSDAGLRAIADKLREAHERINRSSARFMNLFLAYSESKGESDRT